MSDYKVALITGAASGMGFVTAKKFVEEGVCVQLLDVNAEAVAAKAKELDPTGRMAQPRQVDVRDYSMIEACVAEVIAEHGRIDILVNCAGGAAHRVLDREADFAKEDIEVIDWGIDVNLKGPIYMCRAVIGQMLRQQSGVIINVGSVAGCVGSSMSIDYGSAKAGIIGLSKSLSMYGGPHGIRVNTVSPGPVLTRPNMAKLKTWLGRAAQPEEIADLILYLCSDKAAFITGQNYIIDGGRVNGTSGIDPKES